ncbi:MAG: glutamyl-tRNA reductase [bacterium]
MEVIVLGLNHKTAPIEIREKLSFSKSQISYAHKELTRDETIQEVMLLSTCNRVELFTVVTSVEKGVRALKEFLARFHHISLEILDNVSYCYTQKDAVRHLFRVACSLDSMVVGEPQILGQLKEAYNQALEDQSVGSWLVDLVEKSFHVAKKIRTETGICKNAVSISFAAVELAKKIFDKIEGKSVLLVGAGEMSELAARHLLSNGVKDIYVANRTHSRAEELALQFNGQVIPFASLKENLELMDIIITSTSAPHFVFHKEEIQKTLHRRKNRPLFFIDIAVPRNVDPSVSKCADVYVYDIDDLQMVVNSNLLERQKEAKYAEAIVERSVERFWDKMSSENVVPTIVELTQKVEAIRQQELKKAFSKLPNLSDADREVINCLALAITKKVLHDPICMLRKKSSSSNTSHYIQTAKELFNLDGFKRS